MERTNWQAAFKAGYRVPARTSSRAKADRLDLPVFAAHYVEVVHAARFVSLCAVRYTEKLSDMNE